MDRPVRLIVIALFLLLAGVILPFVMVLELVRPTLVLSFVSYGCSTSGLVMGFVGIAQYLRTQK